MTGADTAARSLAHWSEAGRAEMNAFYVVARRDYRLLAEVADWRALLDGRRTLLDVACGSGKLPEALLRYAELPAGPLRYDLLDPSAFSLAVAARALAPPFAPGARFETTLQALDPVAGPWEVVWAVHALYALAPADLEHGIGRLVDAVSPGGIGLLAHATAESHYLRVYRHFLADFRAGAGTPYSSAEDLEAALTRAGTRPRRLHRLTYDGELAAGEERTLEGYLQRCVFDATVSLEAMLDAPTLGPYLRALRGHDGTWRFPQTVDLVAIEK